MAGKIGQAFLITVAILALIYQLGADRTSPWNSTWFVFLIFSVCWYLLEGAASHWHLFRSPRQKKKNVIYIEQFKRTHKTKKRSSKKHHHKWVSLYCSSDMGKIETFRSILHEHQIETHISDQHTASICPTVESQKKVLQVKPDDYQKSVKILKNHSSDFQEK